MKVLLTGSTGYIGKRLLPVLLEEGHEVVCIVRDKERLDIKKYKPEQVTFVQADLLKPATLKELPKDVDAAYYLVHSMSISNGDFSKEEKRSAEHFVEFMDSTKAEQIIYMGGITNEQQLSKHLKSRKAVEEELRKSKVPVTALRAGIVIGSGSASFEIIRDLVEKLPVMVAPRWLKTKCQPIAIRNVVQFLSGVLLKKYTYNQHFDIYGPDILTYKQMLLQFAQVRKLKRRVIVVPLFTPRLSSYWLYFVTSTSFPLAKNLVDSMKVDVIAEKNDLAKLLHIDLIPYREAISMAFEKIEQNMVLSSWNDAGDNRIFAKGLASHIEIPKFGVFTNRQTKETKNPAKALERIFAIGGRNGWYMPTGSGAFAVFWIACLGVWA